MPIYAYKCVSCGFAKDVLQKMSDAPLQICPTCNQPTFQKQVTAAGFQLKGSGWYATDFKGGVTAAAAPAQSGPTDATKPATTSETPAPKVEATPAASAPTPPAA